MHGTISIGRLLLAATALVSFPAAAQNSQGTPSNGSHSGQPEKQFKFEVLSIRPITLPPGARQGIPDPTPNGFTTTVSLSSAVKFAYGPPGPIVMWLYLKSRNEPSWFYESYAIEARVSQADLKAWQNQSRDHELLRAALRAALKERCKLTLHEEPSQERIYELVIAKGGPKLKEAAADTAVPVGVKLDSGGATTGIGNGGWNYHGATMRDLALNLSLVSPGMPVRDRTGLTGRYDFVSPHVQIQPGEEPVYSYPVDSLGLKLKPSTENIPILVIDHAEKPTPN